MDDLVKRLRHRADEDRAIQKNNEAVAAALKGQRLLFDQGIRSNANNFAVRLGLDYENCARKDAKLSQDWSDAADRIEQLEAEVTCANAATAAAYEVAAQAIDDMRRDPQYSGEGCDPIIEAIRALATPDQTAALDKLIVEAVKPYAEALRVLISHTHECERELTEALYHADFCGESRPLTDARAILAASKKGGA